MYKVQAISREVAIGKSPIVDPSETTRRTPFLKAEIEAYLQGALHDASLNKVKRYRFTQKGTEWLHTLKDLFAKLGYRAWIYREGKRSVYTLETLAPFLDFQFDPEELITSGEKASYLRGFFDAEGGIPHHIEAKFYIQLVQKNRLKIEKIVALLTSLGIATGTIHNPSSRVDPDYWRVYIRTNSHKDFVRIVSSWHPVKSQLFLKRMKI